ncbi:acyl CoA:acetate/3-ketoacid CoA transferase beta subunit [Thermocatellispora tengchongensis]|uniref:Acyl CoA:acetate/3-ketoacid CoA transferase beta subunit n=1 Tax=Thermocatellispora tengchongensis TaxID=1073253 RepID=A0A840PPU1_9ACTN|nr:CoA-transferase [Thermocatellispora tengchongensis]MBB5139097.1 acyl CoA:acetate/3-ketoacid CoA transferase beta subunit [Thermocatellispora tengchongensis]
MTATRAEVCVAACAEAWRGDGEVLAAAMGVCSVLGARLARMTFAPDLLTTDGGALLTAAPIPYGAPPGPVEGWLPFRDHLWLVLNGRRHVMMGASQIDRHGNTNISAIGPWARPRSQLLGSRGAPGNTICCPTSYWIPRHSTRVFVPEVDMASGVGTDRAAALGPRAARFHDLRRVVTDLAVLDLGGPGGTMRLLSVHPGVTVDEVVAATGFPLAIGPGGVPETPEPGEEELRLIRDVLDPGGAREAEVPG